jgi:hypothetical protein
MDNGGNVCIASACADVRIVFATSTLYQGADLVSALDADAECASRASAAGLSGTFMAWVSDSTTSPDARFTQAAVSYVLLDGTQVANDYADLTNNNIDNPIDVDEFQTAVAASSVWTGTGTDGTAGADHCVDWTSSGSGESAVAGSTGATNGGWTDGGTLTCENTFRIYCFEQ